MAGKEAVVFILDANPTMNAPYPHDGAAEAGLKSNGESHHIESTRLSQAKDAALSSIIDSMWRSKTHEVGVLVLKAGVTHHHLSEINDVVDDVHVGEIFTRCGGGVELNLYDDGSESDAYSNLVEFGLNRPTPSTLRAIKNVQCTINESISSKIQGDLCGGLILAADTLYRRTKGKKYKRTIVMITDAEHEVEVNGEQLQCALDGLNSMEVQLLVIGIGFEEGVTIPINDEDSDEDFDKKPDAIISTEKDFNTDMIKEEGNPDTIMGDVKLESRRFIKRENEKLLLSIVQETKGCILAANGANLTGILQTKLPSLAGMKKSQRKKLDFRIAPNLTVIARSSKLTEKQNLPNTIKEAYQFDPATAEKLRDGNDELMTSPVRNLTDHFDNEDYPVPFDKRTDAYTYGSDLIPVGKMDVLGINAAFTSPESIEMIGYLDRKNVVSSNLLMGPAYAVAGGESKKSRTAVAALSRALEETEKVGFCRIVRTKNGDPKIGALLPKLDGCDDWSFGPETQGKGGRYLVFIELPFADDLQHHADRPIPLESHGDYKDEHVCDDLIDSMMLPDDEFRSEDISFPALKAYQRMVAHFAMNPLSPEEEMQVEGLAEGRILEASQAKRLCEFDVVKIISKKAAKQINAFVETFPLVEHRPEDDKKQHFWGEDNPN